jgi:4-hydroxy-3-polyprenylbenzoate decarboxylase
LTPRKSKRLSLAYKDVREFIDRLESAGELRRILEPVDPRFEITEITDRVTKRGGPALLFERPKGSEWPVVINLFGSMRRVLLGLGVEDLGEIAADIDAILSPRPPAGLVDKLQMLPQLKRLGDVFPRTVRSGACQEIVKTGDEVKLSALPVLTCWPQDGGPTITFPLVFTKDPETGRRNVGLYRMQVFDDRTTAMHWHPQKGGRQHYRVAEALGARLEVAVAIGADPATMYSASAPLPEDMDELVFAGFIRKAPVELVKCRTVSLEVPANAEIVLEGYVDPGERRIEGPFGDHTGFYSLEDEFPVFHVTAITHRRNPIYVTTIVGPPPQEDYFLGHATERLFLPVLRKTLPEVVDYHMPAEGVFHNMVIVAIDKRYPGHARKVANAFFGLGQMGFCKVLVVVDRDVNPTDVSEVAWKALNNIDPERDVFFVEGPIDILDHSSRLLGYGSKVAVDATRKWPEEGFTRRWPDVIEMSPEVKARVDELWGRLGLS